MSGGSASPGSRFRRGQCRLASREPALREVRLLGVLGDGMPWRVVARLSGPDEMVFFTCLSINDLYVWILELDYWNGLELE